MRSRVTSTSREAAARELGSGHAASRISCRLTARPGWRASTVGIKAYDKLPKAARDYLARIEALAGVPVDIISTGPDRDETIVRRHPYAA